MDKHEHLIASFGKMGMGEPISILADGGAAVILTTPGWSGNPAAYRLIAKALTVEATNVEERAVLQGSPNPSPLPAPGQLTMDDDDDPGDTRTVTTQGPPLVRGGEPGLTSGRIAGNKPFARTPGGNLVPPG